MEFGTIPWLPTVDIFELVLALILVLFALPAGIYNVREAWNEKEWAIDDLDPAMRRLGVYRYDNARLLLLSIILIAAGNFSALLVPSVLQLAATPTVDFQDILNAVLQRIVYILVVLCLTYKAVNDAVWRWYADGRRQEPPKVVVVEPEGKD